VAKLSAPSTAVTRQDVLKVRRRALLKSHRGEIVVQKWPRPRHHTQSPLQQAWTDRFSCLARELKSPFPWMLDDATGWAKGQEAKYGGPKGPTGWYYRDVLESAAYGKLIRFQGEVRVRTPTVKVTRTATQSLAANTETKLQPSAEVWDNNNFWSASVNPTRITFKSPGLYAVGAAIERTTGGTSRSFIALKDQAGNVIAIQMVDGQTAPVWNSLSSVYYFHANEYMELSAYLLTGTSTWKILNLWAVAITPEALVP